MTRCRWLMAAGAMLALAGLAHAEEVSLADRLALRFANVCLRGPLSPAGLEAKLQRLNATRMIDTNLRISNKFFLRFEQFEHKNTSEISQYELSWTQYISGKQTNVNCNITAAEMPLENILQALSRIPELGSPNANGEPTILRTDALWLIKTDGQPAFVSLTEHAFGKNMLIIAIGMHNQF